MARRYGKPEWSPIRRMFYRAATRAARARWSLNRTPRGPGLKLRRSARQQRARRPVRTAMVRVRPFSIDVRYRLLPDIVTGPLLWGGLLANMTGLFVPLPDAVFGATAGYVGLRAISCLVTFAARSKGIGHGDFKLLAALGAWLGWAMLPLLVAAAAVSLTIWAQISARGPRLRLRESMAFGPFLALAGIVGACLELTGAVLPVR